MFTTFLRTVKVLDQLLQFPDGALNQRAIFQLQVRELDNVDIALLLSLI